MFKREIRDFWIDGLDNLVVYMMWYDVVFIVFEEDLKVGIQF